MVIGIDIDDTITNSSDVFIEYAKLYNKNNNIKFEIDTRQLDQKKAFGWNKYNQKKFIKENLDKILSNAKPKNNCIYFINKLRDEGNKIYFITSRNNEELDNISDITKQWLINNNFHYDKLITNCFDKSKICKKYNVDIFIDDNVKNCKLVYSKIRKYVFLFNTNYNSSFNYNSIVRVYDWKELYCEINKIIYSGGKTNDE